MMKFLSEIKITLPVVCSIFITGILLGFILPESLKIMILQAVNEKFLGIIDRADSTWLLGLKIFTNNLTVALLLFFLSIIIFLPIFVLLSNGLIIGIFIDLAYNIDALQPGMFITSMISLIPHGIFEIPAFILSAVFGINLVIKLIFGNKFLSPLKRWPAFLYYLKKFIFIILPLLIAAALFEVTVSDYVMSSLDKKYQNQYINENLKMSLDRDFLITNNCHVASCIMNQDSGLTASYSELGAAIYDKELLGVYKSFSRIPHWQETYECQGKYLKLTIYENSAYSVEQALNNQKVILDKLGYTIAEKSNNVYTAKNKNQQIFFTILEYKNKTMLLFYDGESDDILQSIDLN